MEFHTPPGQHSTAQRRCPMNTSNQLQQTSKMPKLHWLLAHMLSPKPHCSWEQPEKLLKKQSGIGGLLYVSSGSEYPYPYLSLRRGFALDFPIVFSWNEFFLPLTGLNLYMHLCGTCCGMTWSQSSSYYVCFCPSSISAVSYAPSHRSITP